MSKITNSSILSIEEASSSAITSPQSTVQSSSSVSLSNTDDLNSTVIPQVSETSSNTQSTISKDSAQSVISKAVGSISSQSGVASMSNSDTSSTESVTIETIAKNQQTQIKNEQLFFVGNGFVVGVLIVLIMAVVLKHD